MKTLSFALALALSATAYARTVRLPSPIRTELRSALEASPFFKSAVKPSISMSQTRTGKLVTFHATLSGMGHDGPIVMPKWPLKRIPLAAADVGYDTRTKKQVGEVHVSGYYRALLTAK